ncbi:hypothetical protein OIV83_001131 [Microbotryomycetes sp. JL201]|nr:hypothetical protein OIV83_001131 [Microbotryomycetes sp. JL201]
MSSSSQVNLLDDDYRKFAQSVVADWNGHSAVVGLLKIADDPANNQIEFVTVGHADEDTLFCIASNTKIITAAALDQLVRQGKVNWTDKVRDLYPGIDLQDDFADQRATLQDVLAHHSGIPRHEKSYRWGDTPAQLVSRLKHLKPSADFRANWQYNNLWYISAAHLVSQISGQPFTEYVKENFFKPLGMTSSTFTPLLDSDKSRKRMATGYVTLPDSTTIEAPFIFDRTKDELEFNAGAGGISSSAKDQLVWAEVMIRQYRRAFKKDKTEHNSFDNVLRPEGIKQLSAGRSLTFRHAPHEEEDAGAYGAGLWTFTYQGERYLKHGGGVPGFTSQVLWSPERGIGIVTLFNGEGNVADILAYRAFEKALGLEKQVDWNARSLKSRDEQMKQWRERKPKPSKGKPVLPLDAYFGRFDNPGYGSIYVCPARQHRQSYDAPIHADCEKVYESWDESARIVNKPDSGDNELYLVKETIFSGSHIAIQLTSTTSDDGKEGWDGQWVTVYPPFQERKDTVVSYNDELVHVEFGMSLEGSRQTVDTIRLWGVWGAGPERESVESDLYWKQRKFDDPEVMFSRA